MLHLFLEDRPFAEKWWNSVRSRPSYTQLEDYPGQGEDDEATHAVAGVKAAHRMRELLDEVRARGKQAY